jgi:hypothetical protein
MGMEYARKDGWREVYGTNNGRKKEIVLSLGSCIGSNTIGRKLYVP